jgi:hypothetical protein
VSEDKDGWIAFLIAAIVIAACVLALCGCDRASAEAMPDERTTEHAPGMPLDAIAYGAPEWMPECYAAYRVYDRTNGEQWWLLVMGNGYAVLPIDEADR